jgi:hypothetical protein
MLCAVMFLGPVFKGVQQCVRNRLCGELRDARIIGGFFLTFDDATINAHPDMSAQQTVVLRQAIMKAGVKASASRHPVHGKASMDADRSPW